MAGDLVGRWHVFRPEPLAQRAVHFAEPDVSASWDSTRLVGFARTYLLGKQVLRPDDFDALNDYYRAAAFKIAGVTRVTALEAVRDALAASVDAGDGVAATAERVQAALVANGLSPLDPWHADLVAQQAITQAYGAATERSLNDPALAGIMPFFRYWCEVDDATRPNHLVWHNHFYKRTNTVWGRIWPPNGFNSYLPTMRVAGRFDGASKARYSGPVAEVETANGRRLSLTINHPVLTRRGFVAAGDLMEGDNLVAHLPSVQGLVQGIRQDGMSPPSVLRGSIDGQHAPPTIEDVFDAFAAEGVVTRLPRATALDFHGDGRFMYGQIDVVEADSFLPRHHDPALLEFSPNRLFGSGERTALATAHRCRMDGARAHVGIGPAAQIDAPSLEAGSDSGTRGVRLLGQLEQRYSGQIAFDQVVSVKIRSWSGHVYDLQSPNGWIVAEGIIASNCRCKVKGVNIETVRTYGIVEDDIPRGGAPDPGFAKSPSSWLDTQATVPLAQRARRAGRR